ncbi:hypothetical protein BH10PSE4_BH10PSE4_06490 [soil metagenome]
MSDFAAGSRNFDIGRVISMTFGVIGRNFVTFLVLALILGGVPKLLVALAQAPLTTGIDTGFGVERAGLWMAGALAMMIASFVLQAAIVHATVTDLNGRKVAIGESLAVGLRNCLPLIGLAILMGAGLMLGFVLLIVPGIILAVMWSVAVPAKVVERIGVFDAFSRSGDLTRGRRWPIFALILIYLVLGAILQSVIVAVCAPFGAAAQSFTATSFPTQGFVQGLRQTQLITTPIIGTVSALISSAGAAALYYELRSSREGVGPEAMAAVFD